MALRFDRCTIDPDAFELRRDGEVVPVEPQVLELLLFLATNPGRLVTRDELVEAVWRAASSPRRPSPAASRRPAAPSATTAPPSA